MPYRLQNRERKHCISHRLQLFQKCLLPSCLIIWGRWGVGWFFCSQGHNWRRNFDFCTIQIFTFTLSPKAREKLKTSTKHIFRAFFFFFYTYLFLHFLSGFAGSVFPTLRDKKGKSKSSCPSSGWSWLWLIPLGCGVKKASRMAQFDLPWENRQELFPLQHPLIVSRVQAPDPRQQSQLSCEHCNAAKHVPLKPETATHQLPRCKVWERRQKIEGKTADSLGVIRPFLQSQPRRWKTWWDEGLRGKQILWDKIHGAASILMPCGCVMVVWPPMALI